MSTEGKRGWSLGSVRSRVYWTVRVNGAVRDMQLADLMDQLAIDMPAHSYERQRHMGREAQKFKGSKPHRPGTAWGSECAASSIGHPWDRTHEPYAAEQTWNTHAPGRA